VWWTYQVCELLLQSLQWYQLLLLPLHCGGCYSACCLHSLIKGVAQFYVLGACRQIAPTSNVSAALRCYWMLSRLMMALTRGSTLPACNWDSLHQRVPHHAAVVSPASTKCATKPPCSGSFTSAGKSASGTAAAAFIAALLLGDMRCSAVVRALRPGVSCGLGAADWLAACSADRMAPRCTTGKRQQTGQ
jgi:hypothetical protein